MADTALEKEIYDLEQEIYVKKKQLAELRKREENQSIENVGLTDANGSTVSLEELFQGQDTLMVIQNMGKSCNYCTLWADEINGILPHLESVAPVVLASSDEPDEVKEFASSRDWNYRLISTKGTDFKKTLGFETASGQPHPGVSILKISSDGTIYQYTKASFGPGDDFCGMWSFLRLFPDSKSEWAPKLKY